MTEPIIKVVGVGGAGNNTIDRLMEFDIIKAEIVAVNTDAMRLLKSKAPTKVLVGREITKGRSTGNDISLGERAAKFDIDRLSDTVGNPDLFFITCGLGGGTGSGVSPIIAELARARGALTIAMVTLPFRSEGEHLKKNSEAGLRELRKNADSVVVIPNEKLLDMYPELPLDRAFLAMDKLIAQSLKELIDVVGKRGLVDLGIADLRAIMKDGNIVHMAVGRAENTLGAIEKAINSPFMDIDFGTVKGMVVNLACSSELLLKDAEEVVRVLSKKSPGACIMWGTQIDGEFDEHDVKALLIASCD